MWLIRWWRQRRVRRRCLHHDPKTGKTWTTTYLIDAGRSKVTECVRCGFMEFV